MSRTAFFKLISGIVAAAGVLIAYLALQQQYRDAERDIDKDSRDQGVPPNALADIEQAWRVIARAREHYKRFDDCKDFAQREAVLILGRFGKLVNADLSNLCLTGLDLPELTELTRVNFTRSNLSYAGFPRSRLDGSNFDETHLGFARFDNSWFNGSSFVGALILRTSFRDASLGGSVFRGARILSADMRRAFLFDNHMETIVIAPSQVDDICFDEHVGVRELGLPIEREKNAAACFEMEKIIRWDMSEELTQTWMGKPWRKWKSGECNFDNAKPGDHACYAIDEYRPF